MRRIRPGAGRKRGARNRISPSALCRAEGPISAMRRLGRNVGASYCASPGQATLASLAPEATVLPITHGGCAIRKRSTNRRRVSWTRCRTWLPGCSRRSRLGFRRRPGLRLKLVVVSRRLAIVLVFKARHLSKAGRERGLLRVAKSRVSMHREVKPGRHVAFLDRLSRVRGVALGFIPFGKIQVAAAAVHIALRQPRNRRDAGIPGPDRFIAVTVETGSSGKFARLRTVPSRLPYNRWIGVLPAKWDQLDQHNESDWPPQEAKNHPVSLTDSLRLARGVLVQQRLELRGRGRRRDVARQNLFVLEFLAVHLFVCVDVRTHRRALQ